MTLLEWKTETESIVEDLKARTERLRSVPLETLNRPVPGHWSALGCIDHLLLSGNPYLPRIRAALEGLPAADPGTEVRFGRVASYLMKMVGPDAPNNVPVPKMAEPPAVERDAETLDRYLSHLEEIRELVRQAGERDCAKALVQSPMSALVRMSVPEALRVIAIHGLRHVGQAERAVGRSA